MTQLRRLIRITMTLGVLSLLSLAFSFLALTDIAHGEEDLSQEWIALRVSFLVILMFIAMAMATLYRAASLTRITPTS